MHYLHTMVRVTDLEASLKFYCDIFGMEEVRRWSSNEGRFTNVFLAAPGDLPEAKDNQSPLLELTYNWPSEDGTVKEYSGGRNFGHLAFRVDNIFDTCQKLMDAGIEINRPPRDGRMAFIKSPDGISIELLQAGESLPEQEPWVGMKNNGTW